MKRSTQPCRTCEGDCRVVHPHWQQYNAQLGDYSVRDFFLNLGYLPDENPPPVGIPRPTCLGVGEVPAPLPAKVEGGWLQRLGLSLYYFFGGAPL